MADLTVVFLTANEHPEGWVEYHKKILFLATKGYPMITVSRKSMGSEFKFNLLDTGPKSHSNMYAQLLKACELAETPYIATAEDDALYPPEHFSFYRPPLDTIAYDMARWSLYWWEPIYSIKQRISNSTLIAPRLEYIEALSERLRAFQDRPYISEVGRYESQLRVKERKVARVYCDVPTIHFNSPNGTDIDMGKRKKLGQIKAYDIPVWGRAEGIIEQYC